MEASTPVRVAALSSPGPAASPQPTDGSPGQLDALAALMGLEPTDEEDSVFMPGLPPAAQVPLVHAADEASAKAEQRTPDGDAPAAGPEGSSLELRERAAAASREAAAVEVASAQPPAAAAEAAAAAAASDIAAGDSAADSQPGASAAPASKSELLDVLGELCFDSQLDLSAIDMDIRMRLAAVPNYLRFLPGDGAGADMPQNTTIAVRCMLDVAALSSLRWNTRQCAALSSWSSSCCSMAQIADCRRVSGAGSAALDFSVSGDRRALTKDQLQALLECVFRFVSSNCFPAVHLMGDICHEARSRSANFSKGDTNLLIILESPCRQRQIVRAHLLDLSGNEVCTMQEATTYVHWSDHQSVYMSLAS